MCVCVRWAAVMVCVRGAGKVSGGTENALKERSSGGMEKKSVTAKNTGSVFTLIILSLKAAHFQNFLTTVIFTPWRQTEGMGGLRKSS